jgi:hypothetical protein
MQLSVANTGVVSTTGVPGGRTGPQTGQVLHSRKVRIDRAASDPFTTHEVLAEMHGTPLRGKRVVVQRYGETNRELPLFG